jgi:hypothetical protein
VQQQQSIFHSLPGMRGLTRTKAAKPAAKAGRGLHFIRTACRQAPDLKATSNLAGIAGMPLDPAVHLPARQMANRDEHHDSFDCNSSESGLAPR